MRALALLALLLPAVASAQLVPAGPDFQANTFTLLDQGGFFRRTQDVCTHADGGFVVVWESYYDQDGDSMGVFGQRYDSAGARSGTEFQVNIHTPDEQREPDVACLDDGGFVVVWRGYNVGGSGPSARRYDSVGAPVTAEVDIGASTDDSPSVAAQPGAGFVATWMENDQVRSRRFASNGTALGSAILVSAPGDFVKPRVDTDPAGNFVVVWQGDDFPYGVSARRFASDGTALGTEFVVQPDEDNDQIAPDVSLANDGGFVVAWRSECCDYRGIVARRFDSTGAALGSSFQVNVPAEYSSYYHGVSVDHDDGANFVVVWTHWEPGPSLATLGILGRRFDSTGTALGTEFHVNGYSSSYQIYGRVAALPAGQFVVVWASDGQDGSGMGVFGRRFVTTTTTTTTTTTLPACEALVPRRTRLAFRAAGKDTLHARAELDPASEAFDPQSTDTIELEVTDGAGATLWQSGPIPPGPRWSKSNPTLRRFKWRDPAGTPGPGLRMILLEELPRNSGHYQLQFRVAKGTLLLPIPTTGTHRVRLGIAGGACFEGAAASCTRRPKVELCTTP